MFLGIYEVCSWSFKDGARYHFYLFTFSHYHFQFHLVKIILVFYRWIKAAGTVDSRYHFCPFHFHFLISSLSLSLVQNNFGLLQMDLAAGAVSSRYHFLSFAYSLFFRFYFHFHLDKIILVFYRWISQLAP